MWFLKASLPGSLPFLLAALLVVLFLLHWPKTLATGRRLLWSVLALYLLFSLPAGSRLVVAPLAWGFGPIESAADARGANTVVVLDGGTIRWGAAGRLVERVNGASALRAIEALRVAALLDRPLIVVTGGLAAPIPGWSLEGELLRQEIVHGGIPVDRVVLDPTSQNTRAHAVTVTRLLRQRGITRFVLVTSATHIRRAAAAFRVEGADPVPSPAKTEAEIVRGWRAFWPSPSALVATEASMHDYLGLFYYWWRGWV
jgi:uncharacterized SAM-binding protein YcdF (DUF218 family)